jgi:hypothetical protein
VVERKIVDSFHVVGFANCEIKTTTVAKKMNEERE